MPFCQRKNASEIGVLSWQPFSFTLIKQIRRPCGPAGLVWIQLYRNSARALCFLGCVVNNMKANRCEVEPRWMTRAQVKWGDVKWTASRWHLKQKGVPSLISRRVCSPSPRCNSLYAEIVFSGYFSLIIGVSRFHLRLACQIYSPCSISASRCRGVFRGLETFHARQDRPGGFSKTSITLRHQGTSRCLVV